MFKKQRKKNSSVVYFRINFKMQPLKLNFQPPQVLQQPSQTLQPSQPLQQPPQLPQQQPTQSSQPLLQQQPVQQQSQLLQSGPQSSQSFQQPLQQQTQFPQPTLQSSQTFQQQQQISGNLQPMQISVNLQNLVGKNTIQSSIIISEWDRTRLQDPRTIPLGKTKSVQTSTGPIEYYQYTAKYNYQTDPSKPPFYKEICFERDMIFGRVSQNRKKTYESFQVSSRMDNSCPSYKDEEKMMQIENDLAENTVDWLICNLDAVAKLCPVLRSKGMTRDTLKSYVKGFYYKKTEQSIPTWYIEWYYYQATDQVTKQKIGNPTWAKLKILLPKGYTAEELVKKLKEANPNFEAEIISGAVYVSNKMLMANGFQATAFINLKDYYIGAQVPFPPRFIIKSGIFKGFKTVEEDHSESEDKALEENPEMFDGILGNIASFSISTNPVQVPPAQPIEVVSQTGQSTFVAPTNSLQNIQLPGQFQGQPQQMQQALQFQGQPQMQQQFPGQQPSINLGQQTTVNPFQGQQQFQQPQMNPYQGQQQFPGQQFQQPQMNPYQGQQMQQFQGQIQQPRIQEIQGQDSQNYPSVATAATNIMNQIKANTGQEQPHLQTSQIGFNGYNSGGPALTSQLPFRAQDSHQSI